MTCYCDKRPLASCEAQTFAAAAKGTKRGRAAEAMNAAGAKKVKTKCTAGEKAAHKLKKEEQKAANCQAASAQAAPLPKQGRKAVVEQAASGNEQGDQSPCSNLHIHL